MKKLNIAILFWFYKHPKICKNRLKLIKKYNPNLKIYGLYGGDQKEKVKYIKYLGDFLDDFYISPFKSPEQKWVHGDLMVLDWYKKRGKGLEWDSVAVVQWDALIFDSLYKIFSGMKKDQIFLSGLRKPNNKIRNKWTWISSEGKNRKNYLQYLDYVNDHYNYKKADHPICLFIFQIFPRVFFEKYLTVKNRIVGMLEYKIPIYSEIFKIVSYKKNLGVLWFSDPKRHPLNAILCEIEKSYIMKELKKENGWKIFHPYYKIWK